jgi:hypothetical protein
MKKTNPVANHIHCIGEPLIFLGDFATVYFCMAAMLSELEQVFAQWVVFRSQSPNAYHRK